MDELLRQAAHAYSQHDFYEVHEILEPLWKAADPPIKPFYQGLIQVACAFLKAERGEVIPALRLFDQGIEKLEPYPELQGFVERSRAARERLSVGERYDPSWVPDWPLTGSNTSETNR